MGRSFEEDRELGGDSGAENLNLGAEIRVLDVTDCGGNADEECGEGDGMVLRIGEGNATLGSAKDFDVTDRAVEVEVSGILGETLDGEKYRGDLGSEEDAWHLEAAPILEAKELELESDDLWCPVLEKFGMPEDIENVLALRIEVVDNVGPCDVGSGYEEFSSEGKDVEEEDQRILVEPPKQVNEKEHDDLRGVSPFETSKGGNIFDGVGNGCGQYGDVVLPADLYSDEINRDGEENSTEERSENLFCLDAGKVNRCQCSGSELCPGEENRKEDKSSLATGRSLPFECLGSRKEECKDSSCSEDTIYSHVIVSRRSNPKRGATLRSNLAEEMLFNQLNSTRNNRRNNQKAVDISSFFLSEIKISDKLKRKRSSSRRPARPFVWGPLKNMVKIFLQNGELANEDSDKVCIQSRWSKKGRSTVDRKKRMKPLKDGNTPESSDKTNSSSSQSMSHFVLGLQGPDYQNDFGHIDEAEASQKMTGNISDHGVKSHGQLGDRDIESSLTQEESAEPGECPGVSSQVGREMQVVTVSDRNSINPGTSPDSIVYNPVMDVGGITSEGVSSSEQVIGTIDVGYIANEAATSENQVTGTSHRLLALKPVSEDDHHSVVADSSSKALVNSLCAQPLDARLCDGFEEGKMNDEVDGHPCSLQEEISKNSRKPSQCRQKNQDPSQKNSQLSFKSIRNTTRRGKNFVVERSVNSHAELEDLRESTTLSNGLKGVSNSLSTVLAAETKGKKLRKSAKSGRKREKVRKKKGRELQKSDNRCGTTFRSQKVDTSVNTSDQMRFSSVSANPVSPTMTRQTQHNCKSNCGSTVLAEDAPNESDHTLEQFFPAPAPAQVAWVLCDDCEKWRCISVELANALEETKSKWTCKANMDKAFADCSIPQEKTNAEINAELGIPDEDELSSVDPNSNGLELSNLAASQRASWILIKSNLFLHRNRRTQTIDEIMVCHCKPSQEGRLGCRDECLNRMLNIECVRGTCPCGDRCSNQRFQKRKYAKFKWFRCGKKGYGLQLQDSVSQGQFLIEYVGEVLDLAAYEARQRLYASRGHKHFYFMTLNGGEVIDACVKGNSGRFINHSCDPNCRTEKWMVNGEVCIGLFAIRDIKKGEEVTFDYNYVRVVGAAVKKCICGSSECRGYIGGDPLNSEVIVQSDSDEEDIEPVMPRRKSGRELNAAKLARHEENCLEREQMIVTLPRAILEPETKPLPTSVQALDPVQSDMTISKPLPHIQPLEDSIRNLNCVQDDENICKQISEAQPAEISLQASTSLTEAVTDSGLDSKKLNTDTVEEKAKTSKPLTKSSRSSSKIKKGRSNVKILVAQKPRALAQSTTSGQFEGVEEKLNELLDLDGGISKQKDATRGYLKLLFVTAAEGDVGGCTSQSSRDLSLILDAILKTKSRKVLMDVINKNGLQMLHNILKQNRGNFNRIPIIRKLLKVLEFLALTGILTIEQINKDPPFSGMESFKESILKLANHADKQVHKIAREFRDKWILRTIRSVKPSDRREGDRQHSYRPWMQSSELSCHPIQASSRDTDAIVISDAIVINTVDNPPSSSCELDIFGETIRSHRLSTSPAAENGLVSMTKTRKRKIVWDYPSDTTLSIEDQTVESSLKYIKPTPAPSGQTFQLEDSKLICGSQIQVDDEGPPGFGLSQNDTTFQVSSEIDGNSGEVVMGLTQEIYLSHLNISYGFPVALVQELGIPENVGINCNPKSNWAVAPGMPFHPFPPLPLYPRRRPNLREQRQELSVPSTSGGKLGDNSQFNGRTRFPNNGCRRRFLYPQRFDNQRFGRCWPYQRFGRGFRTGGVRNGPVRRDVGWGRGSQNGVNYNDVRWGPRSNFHQ